jgi:hypothetical protein
MKNLTLNNIVPGQQFQIDNDYGYDFFDRAHITVYGVHTGAKVSIMYASDEFDKGPTVMRFDFNIDALCDSRLGINLQKSLTDVTLEEILGYSVIILDMYYNSRENSPILVEHRITAEQLS